MTPAEAARARRAMGITPRTVGPSAARGGLTAAQKKAAFVRGLKAGDGAEAPAQAEATGPKRTQAEKDKLRAAMRRGIRSEGRA